MTSIFKYLKVVLLPAVLLATTQSALAVDERYSAEPLRGNQIRQDSSNTVQDPVYFNPSLKPNQVTRTVRNLITFKIDEFANIPMPDLFEIQIQFKVYFVRDDGGTPVDDSTNLIGLTIKYDKNNAYPYKAIHTFLGGYEARVEIKSVTVLQGTLAQFENVLMLENEILIIRDYSFDCSNNAVTEVNSSGAYVSTKGELLVSWEPEMAADEYDLEWTWVDDAAQDNYKTNGDFDPNKIFTRNATRVSITGEQYFIPLLYDGEGFLFYRVRAVQVKANGQRMESLWSSEYEDGLGEYVFAGHENTLNWQASTSFAEEGKRKSVVQYYDGSLRNRQTVTKDNTTDTTIVAETFYDYQGRPVIQVMPSPSLSSIIKYTPNFNRPVNGIEYEKDLYDGDWEDSCYCTVGAPPLDSLYGASNYYSPANPLAGTRYHTYIPDAEKFPFSETRYSADNTGRVTLQGGVGRMFQIGVPENETFSHETKYIYGSPDQEELDALFGTEVGNYRHYFKNMVRDANGQYSVSYVDMHGRTIATALAGKPRADLDTLVSNRTQLITKKLLDSNSNVINGTSIESSKALVVTKAGEHIFHYSLMPDSISIKDCLDTAICYDCMYDLEITISDDCNNTSLPGDTALVIRASNLSIDTNCNANVAFPSITDTVYLSEGTYLVTKKLTVSKPGMYYYRDSLFMRRNACKSLENFIEEQKAIFRLTMHCAPNCDSCGAVVLGGDNFGPLWLAAMGIPGSEVLKDGAFSSYQEMVDACDHICKQPSAYKLTRDLMLHDVTPPYGQYANPDNVTIYSIFYNDKYKSVFNEFDKKVVLPNGEATLPSEMTREEFIANFQPEWLTKLLTLHPEYCFLQNFESTYPEWEDEFLHVTTFAEAMERGYLNPGPWQPGESFPSNSNYRDIFWDFAPFEVVQEMADSVAGFRFGDDNSIDIWHLATVMTICPEGDGTCLENGFMGDAFDIPDSCSGDLDIAWRYFQQLYIRARRNVIYNYVSQTCALPYPRLQDYDHFEHFPPQNETSPEVPTDETQGHQKKDELIADNCASYVEQWWNELKPCNYNTTDTAWIFPRLRAVCREGGDESHLFGASTVKPSSTYEYRSFEEVLKAYDEERYNATCNVYLISAPRRYEAQTVYYDKTIFQKPDSCECSTISYHYEQYQLYGQNDTSFAAYIYRTTGTRMYDGVLDTLRMVCNDQIDCRFLKSALVLPPVLQCGGESVCASCNLVDSIYQDFKEGFPHVIPRMDDVDTTQQKNNRLFERYMNMHLGFTKQTWEYLEFMDTCKIISDEPECNVALAFDGATNNKRVKIALNNDRLDLGTGNFTFEALLKPKTTTGFNPIITNRTTSSGSTADGFMFVLLNNGNLLLQLQGCYNYITNGTGGIDPYDGKAHHVAVTRDGDSIGFYMDGVKLSYVPDCGTGLTTPPSQRNITTSGPWFIGLDSTGALPIPFTAYNGWIDDIRCWNLARSQSEIANNIYTRLSPQAGLIAYYPLNGKDTCEQTIIDYSTDDPAERNNGIRGYTAGTESTDPAWLSAAQISYDNADPVGVPNNCVCDAGPVCDTLVKWLDDFREYNHKPNLDASGADTTNWKVNFGGTAWYRALVPLAEVFHDGIAQMPAYYVDTVTGKDHVDFDRFFDTLCLPAAGFDFSLRVKMPDSLWIPNFYQANWWIRLNSDTNTSGSLLAAFSPYAGQGSAVCTHLNDSQGDCHNDPSAPSHFNDWRVIKLQFRGTNFKLYLDDTLKSERTLTHPFTELRGFTLLQWAFKAQYDYVRITDTSGKFLYNEEFDDALNLALPDTSIRCEDCETRFTEYFNKRNNSNYTYSQIDSLYERCTIGLSPCAKYDTSSLQVLRDEFINDYYNFGRKYDSTGCDTITWRLNYSGTFTGYPISYQEAFANDVMQFPDTMGINGAPTQIDYDFVWRDTACVERKFTLEYRMRQEHFRYMRVEMWFMNKGQTTRKFYLTFDSLSVNNNICAFYDYGPIENNREYTAVSEFRQDYSDWRVLTFQVIDSVLKFYLDGVLIRSFDFPSTLPVWKLYGFGIASSAHTGKMSAEFDYVKCYDKDGRIFYFDDFSDCSNRPLFEPFIRCPKQPCSEAFTDYFNNKLGTGYTFGEIQSLYSSQALSLDICGAVDNSLTLCGKADPIFPDVRVNPHSPCDDSTLFATATGTLRYEAYRDSLNNVFNERYLAKCLNARYNETFTVQAPTSEYHYTLLYYDQAGNLVKTVPPQGVNMDKFGWLDEWSDSVKLARANKEWLVPEHKLETNYRYNTLDKVVAEKSPDGGLTQFWHDRIGRITISQNLKQRLAGNSSELDRQYTYTRYDQLGRLIEVGQVANTSANGAMTDAISRDTLLLKNWLANLSTRTEQITRTVYDLPFEDFLALPDQRLVIKQRNLRNRVSFVSYSEANTVFFHNATFYTYDILGNIDTLLQDYGMPDNVPNMMNANGNRWKKFVYQYDLISGKVNMIAYQPGWSDRFYHRFTYDGENRLTMVETSLDSLVWERDARYEYYRHGPLARMTIGEQLVQGVDYAYTLHGWMKGVNSTFGAIAQDIGEDGKMGSLNQYTARDALGLSLNYFTGDYASIQSGVTPFPGSSGHHKVESPFRQLYNGNIASTSTYNRRFESGVDGGPLLYYNYKYDQLNRLTKMDVYKDSANNDNSWQGMSLPTDTMMRERITYDANGNILHYRRHAAAGVGTPSSTVMDNMSYHYYPGTNQLRRVVDTVDASKFGGGVILDIDNQPEDNYKYDPIGNLTKDSAEQITNIKWNIYGKVVEVTRNSTGPVPITTIKYTYDASGRRISKIFDLNGQWWYTWYVRDAQGNVLITYTSKFSGSHTPDQLNVSAEDRYIYGTGRMGLYSFGNSMDGGPGDMQYYNTSIFERGRRQYELTNHLGNVLATISDKRIAVTSGGGSLIDHYEPDIVSANDYYPFGMVSRLALASTGVYHRYGFNGQEFDWEVKGWQNVLHAENWEYDPRIGRRWNIDPIVKEFESPYAAFSNNPIWFADPDGADTTKVSSINELQNKVQVSMDALAWNEEQINKSLAALEEMKGLINQKIVSEVGMSWNIFSWVPQMLSDAIRGGSDLDEMMADYANVVKQTQGLIDWYNKFYEVAISASAELKTTLKNSTHLDLGEGVILSRLDPKKSGAAFMLVGKVHLNSNAAKGTYALYEIVIDGEVYKYGIADAARTTASGEPVRFAQQVSKLKRLLPNANIIGNIKEILTVTKAEMKVLETKTILEHARLTGFIPDGNPAHWQKITEFARRGLYPKAISLFAKYFKL